MIAWMREPLVDPYANAMVEAKRHKSRLGWVVAAIVVVLLVAGGAATTAVFYLSHEAKDDVRDRDEVVVAKTRSAEPIPVPPPGQPIDRTDLTTAEQHTIGLFRAAAPSVVFITRISLQATPFHLNAMEVPSGTGSGFVWDDQGHVVTNFHVIRGASSARVTLSDQTSFDAELVGTAPDKDIAVLKIAAPAAKIKALPVGASSNLLVGQHVLAIGNPFGLDHTLSTGVISGLGREIESLAGTPITGMIQTDAAINPGNSGGPLLDSKGRLIGINTAIFSPSGASAGIGFAVPVDTVKRIVPQLIEHGRVERPGLGIQIAEESVAARAGIKGVLVLGIVPRSGAEKAGLRATTRDPNTGDIVLGDVVVGLDGKAIERPTDLFRELDAHRVGDVVKLTVKRGADERTVEVTLTPIGD